MTNPPSEIGGFQLITAEDSVTLETFNGPSGEAGTPKRERNCKC